MLAPVAQKILEPVVGHDAALIWFGVMLCVNVQTSFMHPPFGFALFYLRSVAPAKDYLDKLTGRLMPRVTTGQIYWGAVPFVLIQIVMIALVIAFPQMVMVYKAKESTVDPTKIQIQLPPTEMTPSGQSGAEPTEQQEQKSEDEASKSLEDQFKTAPPPETKK